MVRCSACLPAILRDERTVAAAYGVAAEAAGESLAAR